MANPLAITLHEAGPEILSGASLPLDIGWPAPNPSAQCHRQLCELTVDLTELDGAGSFELVIETSIGGYDWKPVATAKPATLPAAEELWAFYCERFLRARWSMPVEITRAVFSVIGHAHQCYIDQRDLEQSMPANMFAAMPPEVLAHAMLDASDEAESYLRAHFTMPLISWGHDLRLQVGKMAFYHAMQRRGYNPDNIDQLIRYNYQDALSWLKTTAKYTSMVDSTPGTVETGAYCISGPPRGWYPW